MELGLLEKMILRNIGNEEMHDDSVEKLWELREKYKITINALKYISKQAEYSHHVKTYGATMGKIEGKAKGTLEKLGELDGTS